MWEKVRPGLKYAYSVAITALVIDITVIAYKFTLPFWAQKLTVVEWIIMILGNLTLLSLVYASNLKMKKLNSRFLEWRLFGLNANFVPLEYKSLRYIFGPLIFFNFPLFAFVEEFIFRDGLGQWPTVTVWDVVWRSVVFGLIHCLGGVRIRSGITIILGGVYLSVVYLWGGLTMATVFHLYYNAAAFLILIYLWVTTKENPFND